jgi:hypothetical protein
MSHNKEFRIFKFTKFKMIRVNTAISLMIDNSGLHLCLQFALTLAYSPLIRRNFRESITWNNGKQRTNGLIIIDLVLTYIYIHHTWILSIWSEHRKIQTSVINCGGQIKMQHMDGWNRGSSNQLTRLTNRWWKPGTIAISLVTWHVCLWAHCW